MDTCECGRKMVDAVGPSTAKILLVGDRPSYDDLMRNMPFSDKRGEILTAELQLAGLDIRKCRIVYVWRHEILEKECKGHMGMVLREMVGRPYVLLIGAETVKSFAISDGDKKIGLQVSSVFFPPDVEFAMSVTNPPQNSGIGEFRLALTKFARRING